MYPLTSRCNRHHLALHLEEGKCRCRACQDAPVLVGKASAARPAAAAAAGDAVLEDVVQAAAAALAGSEGLAEPALAPVVSTVPLRWR